MALEFREGPDGPQLVSLPLKGSFYVFFGGRAGGDVRLYLWNATAGAGLALGGGEAVEGGILWGPIRLRRGCDPAPEGVPSLVARVGDLVVAAVDSDGGASAAAPVSPPVPGPRTLRVVNSAGREVTEICCGAYTLVLEAPDLDVECAPETVTFGVLSGGSSTAIPLRETGDATGVFTAALEVECLCPTCELSASVAGLVLPAGAEVSFVNEELGTSSTVRLGLTVATLCGENPVSLVAPFSLSRGEEREPAGEPREGPAPAMAAEPTAAAALPGRDFLVEVELALPPGVREVSLRVEAPPGWGARLGGICREVMPCPVPVGPDGTARVPVILGVPAGAMGPYRVSFELPGLGARWEWEVEVRDCLDPVDVVRHWDVEREGLDLASRGAVTYARLLWAIAHLGERLPFACRALRPEDLEVLAARWQVE